MDQNMVDFPQEADGSKVALNLKQVLRWPVACFVVVLIASYPSAFYCLRKNYTVSSGYRTRLRIYYFSPNASANDYYWRLFYPLHQSDRQPQTDAEWEYEYLNSETVYFRDVRPLGLDLDPP
jgi:hypothetical protein